MNPNLVKSRSVIVLAAAGVMMVVACVLVASVLPVMALDRSTTQTHVVDDEPTTENTEDCDADFDSIEAAIDAAIPGDTVRVCGGTYDERVNVTTPNILIRATGDAVLHGQDHPYKNWGFRIYASDVTIQNFTFEEDSGITIYDTNRTNVVNNIGNDALFGDGGTKTRYINNTFTAEFEDWKGSLFLIRGNQTYFRNNTLRLVTESLERDCISDVQAVHISNKAQHARLVNNNITFDRTQDCEKRPRGTTILDRSDLAVFQENTISGHEVMRVIQISGNTSEITDNSIQVEGGSGISVNDSPYHRPVRGTIIQNNTLRGGVHVNWEASNTSIKNNTISDSGIGVTVWGSGRTAIVDNKITGNQRGVMIDGNKYSNDETRNINDKIRVENNTIQDNEEYGLLVGCVEDGCDAAPNVSAIEVHHNIFQGHLQYAIYSQNESHVINATDNDWGGSVLPGSPPEHAVDPLKDPYYRDIAANGSGDWVSEGRENGVSNIHFYEPESEETESPPAKPMPTATATVTATPTATLHPSSTPTSVTERATGTGEAPGTNGSGPSMATATGTAGSSIGSDTSEYTATAETTTNTTSTATGTPTATAPTTSTTTPPPTLTATPEIIPGFGVGLWVVGFILLVGLLAIHRD